MFAGVFSLQQKILLFAKHLYLWNEFRCMLSMYANEWISKATLCKYLLQNHFDASVSCNRMNCVSAAHSLCNSSESSCKKPKRKVSVWFSIIIQLQNITYHPIRYRVLYHKYSKAVVWKWFVPSEPDVTSSHLYSEGLHTLFTSWFMDRKKSSFCETFKS